jgi:hypothetical protein
MTEQEAIKIRSAFSNGFEYPFGGGDLSKCDMDEVNEHAESLDTALKKQIPKKPDYEGDGYGENGELIYDTWICPCCERKYEVDYDDYAFCYNCGQALD